ncbi:MAG: GNAT family N-acetyltransferase [Variibacter sp.]
MTNKPARLHIRRETPSDIQAIARANDKAFGGADESALIDRLRADGLVAVSLVAEDDSDIVGHILLSRLAVTASERHLRALALAPMAVVPERQRQGVGTALVRASIDAARTAKADVIVVLGHPDFYPRFGFSAARAVKLAAPFSGDAFMVLELVPGVLGDGAGTVTYPPAFGISTAA